MAETSKSFEASMERLETIVRQLEQGNAPLEDSAEQEIVKLTKTADGTPAETEYVRDE